VTANTARGTIKFSISGWRGIIAEDCTLAGSHSGSQARGEYVTSEESWPKVLVRLDAEASTGPHTHALHTEGRACIRV
jgi:phosphomannomutase